MPFDKVSVIGTDEQLAVARTRLEVKPSDVEGPVDASFGLESLVLDEASVYTGKSIRACGLREAVHGLIVRIERDGQRILNPDSAITLRPEDRLWVVGDRVRIRAVRTPAR
jgi:CPA2 family monovalent cation:H+ antiporter-2